MGRMSGRPGAGEYGIIVRVKSSLTEAPTTVEGVEELVSKKDDEEPDDPRCDVGNSAQDPVATRTRHSRGFRIRESRHSARSSIQTHQRAQEHKLTRSK